MSAVPKETAPVSQTADRPQLTLEQALQRIAARADTLDAAPRFPAESLADLGAAGVLAGAGSLVGQGEVVRRVAAADASTARILDGHLNGAERLGLLAEEPLRAQELAHIARGECLVGVWGADPGPGEGSPAALARDARGDLVLRGVKTFCSGAGGVQRALVVARDDEDRRRAAYVDCRQGVRVDRGWYRASGLRASESHRVEFDDTPVLGLLGGPGELTREPWFSRDAVRTASTWAGIADALLAGAVAVVRGRAADQLTLAAVGRMRVAQSTIDRWLSYALGELDGGDVASAAEFSAAISAETRLAIAGAARAIAAEALRIAGSRALIGGGGIDRAHRDLDLFLLQHRLEPKLVELGARAVEARAR